MSRAIILFACLASLIVCSSGGKASFITPCKWDDEKCLVSSAQSSVPIIAAGIPELGVPAAEPLIMKGITSELGGLKLGLKELKVVGLSKCHVHSLRRDIVKSTLSIVLECPIEASGLYKMGGSLLNLPIQGEGAFNIKSEKLRFSSTSVIKEVDGKDGKKYWKMEHTDNSFEPVENFIFDLENLFGGDKTKAEPMLKLINENSKTLITTLGKPIIDKVIDACLDIISKFYAAVPTDELQLV